MNIIIAGDYCPKDRIASKINIGDSSIISPLLQEMISNATYSIVNFECPVADPSFQPISKKGPNLCCSKKSVDLIKYMGFDCCTLANNHFRDYGDEGCMLTIGQLDSSSIDYVGGGEDIVSAQKVLVKHFDNIKIAFVNFCENEFSIATDNRAGSAPLSLIDNHNQILQAKDKADYVIVIVHGGHEHFQLPSPRMKKTYRWFIDLGADVVVNHHQHCYSGYEIYNGKPIFYGLGNFCFDWNGRQDNNWTEGFLLELMINQTIEFNLHPYIQCRKEAMINEMPQDDMAKFFIRINELNDIIRDDKKLKYFVSHYYEECSSNSEIMMGNLSDNRLVRLLKRKGIIPSKVSVEKKNVLSDYIFCESHRDKIEYWLNKE